MWFVRKRNSFIISRHKIRLNTVKSETIVRRATNDLTDVRICNTIFGCDKDENGHRELRQLSFQVSFGLSFLCFRFAIDWYYYVLGVTLEWNSFNQLSVSNTRKREIPVWPRVHTHFIEIDNSPFFYHSTSGESSHAIQMKMEYATCHWNEFHDKKKETI